MSQAALFQHKSRCTSPTCQQACITQGAPHTRSGLKIILCVVHAPIGLSPHCHDPSPVSDPQQAVWPRCESSVRGQAHHGLRVRHAAFGSKAERLMRQIVQLPESCQEADVDSMRSPRPGSKSQQKAAIHCRADAPSEQASAGLKMFPPWRVRKAAKHTGIDRQFGARSAEQAPAQVRRMLAAVAAAATVADCKSL